MGAQPRLFIVGRSTFDEEGFAAFLHSEAETWRRTSGATDTENMVEAAGRVCYMSFGFRQFRKDNADYINNLIEQGHESVLEHVSWSFVLTGVSRGFSHQFVRHRVGFAYSQLSQQYHDETDAKFVCPSAINRFPHLAEIWSRCVENSKTAYRELVTELDGEEYRRLSDLEKREFKRAVRTAARSVLPNATETKIFFTANARALRYFLKIRGSIPGDEEMRIVCSLLLETLKDEAPALFSDFDVEILGDGSPLVRNIQKQNVNA